MNRVGTTLPERLGSIAWRYQTPLAWCSAPPVPAWSLTCEADEDGLIGDGPTARTERLARLEAVLFLAREPLGTRKLAELADLADGTEARTLVRKLNRLYDEEGCAFRAVEVAGGFQLVSRPQFALYLRRLHGPAVEVRLSAPAMETLSVVAYRQPVLRAAIESIRGVQCGELLRQLMERDLLRICGRSEELGRPFLYGTTKRFLQVFGLRHLDELPPVETELAVEEMPSISGADQQSDNGQQELIAPSDESRLTEEESTVKIEIEGQEIAHPVEELSQTPASEQILQAEFEDDSSFDDEEDDFEDDEEDDLEDDEEDDLEDPDEGDDEGFEESEWEEVEDDEDDASDEEEWEEEEWDDEEEEGWEDEDDDEAQD
jgi:segregation and condensation protein B